MESGATAVVVSSPPTGWVSGRMRTGPDVLFLHGGTALAKQCLCSTVLLMPADAASSGRQMGRLKPSKEKSFFGALEIQP